MASDDERGALLQKVAESDPVLKALERLYQRAAEGITALDVPAATPPTPKDVLRANERGTLLTVQLWIREAQTERAEQIKSPYRYSRGGRKKRT